jgi:two-component system phosphate regulon sensor histidine kinase PhoR
VTLAVAVALVSWRLPALVGSRIERALTDEARLAAETLSHRLPGTPSELDAEADALGRLVSARVTFVAADGTVVGDSELTPAELSRLENHAGRPEIVDARTRGLGVARRYSATLRTDMLYVAVPVQSPAGTELAQVRLALPLTEIDDQLAAVRRSARAAALAGLVTALVLAWGASVLLARRVDAVATAARRYAAGDFSSPAHDYGADEIGTVARVLDGAIRDLRRRAADLSADRARMEAILGGMTEGVLVVDERGGIQLVNPAARRMLKLAERGGAHHYLEVVRHPAIASHVGAALRGEHGEHVEIPLRPGLIVAVRSAPVSAANVTGAVVVLHDITDLRRADRVRRDFVANVSHELRTPLTAIRGYVEALSDGAVDPAQARRFLDVVLRHTLRMERLVRDLLRLARLDAGSEQLDLASCPVPDLVSGVEAELQARLASRRQRIAASIAPDAATIRADPAKLHDALKNLVENAINYSPEGSTIRIGAERAGSRVRLSVADEGPGIPETDLVRVFERFYRVDASRARGQQDPGGTGLGLAIVKHLIELHGGQVSAANRPGGGALFTIDIPAS